MDCRGIKGQAIRRQAIGPDPLRAQPERLRLAGSDAKSRSLAQHQRLSVLQSSLVRPVTGAPGALCGLASAAQYWREA